MSASKNRIYHRLQIAAHRMQKAADRALLSAADITTAQAAVMTIVASDGPVTQRSVAKQLGINKSALTAMTNRLLSLGLLERNRDEVDGRAWQLELTKNGRDSLKKIERPFRQINETIETGLSAEDLVRLSDYLQRIGKLFEDG